MTRRTELNTRPNGLTTRLLILTLPFGKLTMRLRLPLSLSVSKAPLGAGHALYERHRAQEAC